MLLEFSLQPPLDTVLMQADNNGAAFEMRRYLSWIEGLTTNQYVGGSNPSRRTTCSIFYAPSQGIFHALTREGFEPREGATA